MTATESAHRGRARIAEPGEGIGLAHVRSMVRNLGGDITLKSELERCTTMKLSLPNDLRSVTGAI